MDELPAVPPPVVGDRPRRRLQQILARGPHPGHDALGQLQHDRGGHKGCDSEGHHGPQLAHAEHDQQHRRDNGHDHLDPQALAATARR